jgi:hypothetical protein
MNRPLYALAALAASFTLIAAACGGDDGGDADGDTQATATATETTAATSEATSAPTSAPTTQAETPAATTESGTGATTGGLQEAFDSYHHSFSMQMSVDGLGEMFAVTTEGDFVSPDRRTATTNSGAMGFGTSIETVVIGDTVWVRQSGGEWTEYTSDSVPPELAGDATATEDVQLDEETRAQIEDLDGTPETLDGRQTTRYVLDEEFYSTMIGSLDESEAFDVSDFEEFTSTVWIDDETGQAIKLEMQIVALPSAFGSDLEGLPVPPDARISMNMLYEISQINDGGISIEAPAS